MDDNSRLEEPQIEDSMMQPNDGRSGDLEPENQSQNELAEDAPDELNSGNLEDEGSIAQDQHPTVLKDLEISRVNTVVDNNVTQDTTLKAHFSKPLKSQSLASQTPAAPPERPDSKTSIIKPEASAQSESVLTKAEQEAELRAEIDELVNRHQNNFKKFVEPAYNDQIMGYDDEMAQIKEELSHKEAREMRNFIERRKQTAMKVFEILKRDFDKKIAEVLEDCRTAHALTPQLVKTRNSEIEMLYKRLDSRLTVYVKKDEIIESLKNKRITIVVGAPGCGKSTQIPQIILTEKLLSDAKKTVFMVSPRMAAAKKVCDRINDEMGEELCQFHSGEKASIQLATLNFAVDYEFYRRLVITKEVNIEEIEYLIIDEANSKKMYTEVVLSMSRKLMRTHKHLKLVILSTSLNKYELEAFFRSNIDLDVDADDAIAIQDSNFKIETINQVFNGSTEEKINQVLIAIEERILQNVENSRKMKIRNANILMFLRGASDVRSIYQKFCEWLPEKEGLITLSERFKELNIKAKYKIFMASGASDMVLDNDMLKPDENPKDGEETVVKLIFSTKVLETSLTIPNLGYVVDFGEEHVYAFDHKLGVELLREQKISHDTAIQRRGRVGRTCKGVCYRLYKEEDLTEEHSMSELSYKKLDLLVLSWIQIALDYRKTKENPYFDMMDVPNTHDETNPVEATSDDVTQVLSSLMSRFQLTSEIGEESIKKSLELMRQLSIIEKDSLNKPLGDIYKVVLASGTELCFGKTIYRAIHECGGAKDLTEGNSKVPWLLEEVITMIACNTFNRKIVTEKLPPGLEGRLQDLMKQYGDFAHNYEIFKVYDERSGSSNEMEAQLNILRGFANNAHMIRSRIQKILRLPNGYFKAVRDKYRKSVTDDERYKLLTRCLTFGFAPDISVHIDKKIGYYNPRTRQIVHFGKDVAFTSDSDSPEFMVISDILAQETRFVSRFCFKVDLELIRSQFSKIMKQLQTMDRTGLPTKIYERYDLPSELIHSMVYRDFMIKQILDKKKGSIISLSDRLLELKVALPEKSEKQTIGRIETLIDYFRDNLKNHTVELFLEGCRVSVGQGLQITDIMTYRETTSFYHFLVPRYINEATNEVLPDGNLESTQLMSEAETKNTNIGHWDFLLYNYKKYFGIQDKEMRCETTVSKVNYNAGPQMNLKLSFKTLADMEHVREKIKSKQLSLKYSSDVSSKKCEVKFYDKQSYTNDLGNIMKPLILGVILFTKQNLGSCTIKRLSTIEVEQVAKVIKDERHQPDSIFGSNVQVTNGKDFVELTGLPQQLDEYSIYKFLMKVPKLIKYSDPEIKMYKKASNDTSHQNENLDKYKEELEDLIEKMINEKQKTLGSDENFPNEFVCRRIWDKFKKYDYMVEIQVRVTSYQLVELIKEKLDGKYYNSMFTMGEQTSYKLGVSYTHVEEYDRPEFYTQKSAFTKFQPFIDDLNKSIREEVEKRQPSQIQGKGARDSIRKDLTEVIYPEKDHLERLKHDENIRIIIKKGANRDIADQAEKILIDYFAGTEFLISPDQYSFWFGGEGKKFVEQLKGSQQAQDEYAIIQSIPNRSLIVLKALHNSLQQDSSEITIEEQIRSKINALSDRKSTSIYIKVTLREIAILQKSTKFKQLKAKYPNDTISTFTNYGGLVVIETKSEEQSKLIKADVEQEIKKIREAQKNVHEFEIVECSLCGERGNIQRLLLCNHQYCYLCLQQSIFKSLEKAERLVEQNKYPDIREPYVYCPHPSCKHPISSCDIFKVLSEKLITDKMKKIVAKVLQNPNNMRHMGRCGCGTLYREGAKGKPTLCVRCNTKSN